MALEWGTGPDAGAPLAERERTAHLSMVEAVLAGEGLAGVAELAARAAGAPVAVVVPRLGAAVSPPEAGGDLRALERYVDDRCGGRPARVPAAVGAEAPIATGDEVLGSVLLLGPAGADVGELLRVAALAALTEVAVHGARASAEGNVRDAFLEELLGTRPPDGEQVVRRAARLGCDLRRGAVALCAELAAERPHHVLATVPSEHPGALARHDAATGRVHALLPAVAGEDPAAATLAAAQGVAGRLRRHGAVGLSSFYADPGEAGRALAEAELVLEVVRHGDVPVDGAYRLLFRVFTSHPDEVRSFYEDTIAPLVRHDERYGSDLAATLETFLERDCAVGAAAGALFVHRHTVTYRMERVKELTGLDPARTEDRERLGLGLKAHRILAPRLPR